MFDVNLCFNNVGDDDEEDEEVCECVMLTCVWMFDVNLCAS